MEKNTYNGLQDPQFSAPYLDEDEWRDTPIRHRYLHGGFRNTETRFCFYLPDPDVYTGRFFQYIPPFVGDEKEAQTQTGDLNMIHFSVSNGAAFLETNLGGVVNGGGDPTLMYRASASAAQYFRKIAAEFYGNHHSFGYCFGGSGGGYKTISCVENTVDVWDGAVPFVIGSPMAIPYVYTVRAHAMRILRHKLPALKDALEPGGTDPYSILDDEEAEAFREAERMGFPRKAWCVYETLGEGALPLLSPAIAMMDPGYFTDFWTQPGYLGADPEGSAVRDRIQLHTRISGITFPDAIQSGIADTIDEGNAYGADEAWKHAMASGQKLPLLSFAELPDSDYLSGLRMKVTDGPLQGEDFGLKVVDDGLFTIDPGIDARDLNSLLKALTADTEVLLDNSDYIAIQTYHRHQVPDESYHCFDQFRDTDGTPLYPQRPFLTGPMIAYGGAGSVQNGAPGCKLIVLESMLDESAFPCHADWYRNTCSAQSDVPEDERIRFWFNDNCMHTDSDVEHGNGGDRKHIVSYYGILHQALLDLSDWVERGKAPAGTSGYEVQEGIVRLADDISMRKGIQPKVTLTVNGGESAVITAGQEVLLTALVELPQEDIKFEEALWDFEGTETYLPADSDTQASDGRITISSRRRFDKPGTFFPTIKVSANKQPGNSFTKLWNLSRVRVTVQ